MRSVTREVNAKYEVLVISLTPYTIAMARQAERRFARQILPKFLGKECVLISTENARTTKIVVIAIKRAVIEVS
jgi:hypothetical protein